MKQTALDYYLLDTPDALIEKLLMWKHDMGASAYDRGLVYGFCCAMAKLYKEISDFGLTDRLSDRARRFDYQEFILELKFPPCSQGSHLTNRFKDNFLSAILSTLLCDAIDLRDHAGNAKDHNGVKATWLRGQYFGHYSAISTMLNYVFVFDLFHMLPESWHWEKFDPDTLHNGVTKEDLGL